MAMMMMMMMMMMTIGILFSTMPAITMPVASPRCFPTIKPAIDSGKPTWIKIQLRMGTQTKIIARNLAGNPDSPQAVIFLASITDVMMGS